MPAWSAVKLDCSDQFPYLAVRRHFKPDQVLTTLPIDNYERGMRNGKMQPIIMEAITLHSNWRNKRSENEERRKETGETPTR